MLIFKNKNIYIIKEALSTMVQKGTFNNSLGSVKVILLHIQAHGENEVLPVP